MNILHQYLNNREHTQDWQHTEQPAEARLLKFDSWARHELTTRLNWDWAGEHKARRIEQARIYLERLVLDLWRRGWMLDGQRLAARITAMLDTVAAYQQAGKVRDFWPYYRAAVDRYVGLNSEELQAETWRCGGAIGQALAALLKQGGQQQRGPALPELIAQRTDEVVQAKAKTIRAAQSRLRAASKADAQQGRLL